MKREREDETEIWKDGLDRNIDYKNTPHLRSASVVVIGRYEGSDIALGVGSSSCGVLLSRRDWEIVPTQMNMT